MSRVKTAVVTGCVAAVAATLAAAPAQAAPQGAVDVGPTIGWSSNDAGTGCSYSMTVQVNSSGMVSFYERKNAKTKPIFLGRAAADGGLAAITWWPKRTGKRQLYAVQNGERSKVTRITVTRGIGSGGWCFAGPR